MITINCKGKLIDISKPIVMGILNVTPDSFYDGGRYIRASQALLKVEEMLADGADIIDIGGMSSRPGAAIIAPEEEEARILPVLESILRQFPNTIISIDTVHSAVADSCLSQGAHIINDISGGLIDSMLHEVCIKHNAPYILMHMKGLPKTMQESPTYDNVVLEVLKYLRDQIVMLRSKGMKDIIIDPGFGFGKTIDQNYDLLSKLSVFKILDCPIMVGLSRKSMIYNLLDTSAEKALNGTSIAHMIALQNGAKLLRVHDVKEAKECVKIYQQLHSS